MNQDLSNMTGNSGYIFDEESLMRELDEKTKIFDHWTQSKHQLLDRVNKEEITGIQKGIQKMRDLKSEEKATNMKKTKLQEEISSKSKEMSAVLQGFCSFLNSHDEKNNGRKKMI